MGIVAYQQILEAGFQETQVGLIPPGNDQVLVGDIERTRLKHIKVLFLVGINEGIIPKPVSKAGILSEADREYLKQHSVELAPDAREEMYRQRFYLYLNLTKPSDRLYLSYCKSDAKGSALLPSYLIGMICAMFPGIAIRKIAMCSPRERLETPQGTMEVFLEGLQNLRKGRAEADFLELCRWYQRDEVRRRQLDWMMQAVFYEKPQTGIGRAAARALYGKILTNSATRLEQFASCAFAHFLQYGLQLKEREKYEFNAADMGNVMHKTLERFSGKLTQKGYQWAELTEEQRNRLVDESIEEIVHDYGNTILHSSSRNAYLITRVRNMMHCTVWALQEQIQRGAFTPGGFEISFAAEEQLEAANIHLSEDERLKLQGRIDRMDLCETADKIYVKIIDYKTGNTTLDLLALYYGLQLQLAVYLNMAVELEQKRRPDKTVEPAGVYYYHIDDPFVTVESVEETENQEEILKVLKMDGLSREEEEILTLLDRTVSPGGRSSVIPVGYNKNGSLAWYSKVAGKEDFDVIQKYTDQKIRQLGRRMLDGETEISPCITEKKESCTYCPYHGICGFDERIPGFSYRRLPKMTQEEVMKYMKKEMGLTGKAEPEDPEKGGN